MQASTPRAVKLDIRGGDGNDTLDGGDGADLIAGDGGNDTITLDDNPVGTRDVALGGDGDDTMTWNGGDDDDVNDGGAGNDTVTVNGAAAPEAFTLNASATAGHATFDRAATPGPGPFNIDIVASERLDLNANGGDDTFSSNGAIAALGSAPTSRAATATTRSTARTPPTCSTAASGTTRSSPMTTPPARATTPAAATATTRSPGTAVTTTTSTRAAPATTSPWSTARPSPSGSRSSRPRPPAACCSTGLPPRVPARSTSTSARPSGSSLEANAGNDRITGAKGIKGRISTVLNAGDGNDRVRGTDAADAISLGKGNDIANTIDRATDRLSCDQGIDIAFVDRRDFLRRCELVLGGLRRVAIKGKPQLDGNHVALRLKCVATEKCKSVVKLKRNGKVVGRAKATIKRNKTRSINVALNKRGRRVLSDGVSRQGGGPVEGQAGQRLAVDQDRPARLALQPRMPGGPLNGPARPAVIQPLFPPLDTLLYRSRVVP